MVSPIGRDSVSARKSRKEWNKIRGSKKRNKGIAEQEWVGGRGKEGQDLLAGSSCVFDMYVLALSEWKFVLGRFQWSYCKASLCGKEEVATL